MCGQIRRLALSRGLQFGEESTPLFSENDRVLDLGCGTGVDAHHLKMRGVEVYGIDSSAAMVDKARSRGVNAHHHLAIEQPAMLAVCSFDGAISNFGALNCVRSLDAYCAPTGSLHSPEWLICALCHDGTVCPLGSGTTSCAKRDVRKAFRRFAGATTSLTWRRSVLSHRKRPFWRPSILTFSWSTWLESGSSFLLPMSEFSRTKPPWQRLAAIDARVGIWPLLRSLADHRLICFSTPMTINR